MKIINLLVVDAFLFPGGGQEGVVLQLLRLLDRRMYKISFATSDEARLPQNIPSDIRVHRIGLRSRFDVSSCWKIRHFIRQHNIDIVNVHGFRASLLLRLAYALSIRRPYIVYTAQVNYDQLINFSKKPLKSLSVLIGNILDHISTDKIVFVSYKNFKKRIADYPKLKENKCTVIYNGINILDYKSAVEDVKVNGNLKLVCLSALIERKGIHILIEAVHILKLKGIIEFEVRVGGEGSERIFLEGLINKYKLENRFALLGYTDRKQLLGCGDIFILPTYSEGLPLALLEAGLFKLPVIASAVDGIPEVVQNEENGILVSPGNSVELSIAIERLLKDKQLREDLGERLHETVIRDFNESKMIENYSKIFQRQEAIL